jgi:hypothetical protein
MADDAQANWNVVHVVYGIGDPTIKMGDKKWMCFFYWTQYLDKHTKQLIEP